MAFPLPDRAAVDDRAAGVVEALNACLRQLEAKRFDCTRLQSLLTSILKEDAALTRLTAHWDAAAQLYLALAALQECLGDILPLREAMEALRELLMFPEGLDSAGQGYDPAQSRLPEGLDPPPQGYDPAKVRAALGRVLTPCPSPEPRPTGPARAGRPRPPRRPRGGGGTSGRRRRYGGVTRLALRKSRDPLFSCCDPRGARI
jgi:hypothetical protein